MCVCVCVCGVRVCVCISPGRLRGDLICCSLATLRSRVSTAHHALSRVMHLLSLLSLLCTFSARRALSRPLLGLSFWLLFGEFENHLENVTPFIATR